MCVYTSGVNSFSKHLKFYCNNPKHAGDVPYTENVRYVTQWHVTCLANVSVLNVALLLTADTLWLAMYNLVDMFHLSRGML